MNSWFSRIPRGFLKFSSWTYSAYIGIGFVITGFLHFRIWINSLQVENLFTNLSYDIARLKPLTALGFFIITGAVASILFLLLFKKIRDHGLVLELVFWGTLLSLIFSWIPWFFASSIANTVFLFLFCMVSLSGVGIQIKIDNSNKLKKEIDYWKMFVNVTKAIAALLAILLGAIASSILLPWRNSTAEGVELFRYAILCAYGVTGMVIYIVMPLLIKCLENPPVEDVNLDLPGPI